MAAPVSQSLADRSRSLDMDGKIEKKQRAGPSTDKELNILRQKAL